jgi:hypothetical protein
MRFKLVFSLAAVALIGLAASALAQQQPGQPGQGRGRGGGPPGGGGGFGGFLRSRISFLRISEVKKELELADEQVAEIEKVDEALQAKYPNMFGGRGGGPGSGQQGGRRGGNNNEGALNVVPAQWFFVALQEPNQQQGQGRGRGGGGPPTPEQMAEFAKQRLERTREEKAKLAEILLPNQIKRLNEIFVQVNGVGALQDEDIAKELGISEAQKAEMTKVREAIDEAMRTQGREAFAGLDDAARAAKFAEMRKANEDKVLAVLSPAQKTKFEEMKGKPFAMPEGAGRGGFGGGNRGRGGKGGNNN